MIELDVGIIFAWLVTMALAFCAGLWVMRWYDKYMYKTDFDVARRSTKRELETRDNEIVRLRNVNKELNAALVKSSDEYDKSNDNLLYEREMRANAELKAENLETDIYKKISQVHEVIVAKFEHVNAEHQKDLDNLNAMWEGRLAENDRQWEKRLEAARK